MNNIRLFASALPSVAAAVLVSSNFASLPVSRKEALLEEAIVAPKNQQPVLLQSHIIFRHGARTPVFWNPEYMNTVDVNAFRGKCQEVNSPPGVAGSHAYPSLFKAAHLDVRNLDGKRIRPRSRVDSTQLEAIYGECRAGQLTTLGAEQSAQLGKTLRDRYGFLAHSAREKNQLWIRTSNVARCVGTLQFVLGELFFHDDDEGRLDEEERVFLTYTAPNQTEWLYPNTRCSLMAQLMFAAKEDWSRDPSPEAKTIVEELRRRVPKETADALRLDDYNFVRVRDYLVSYGEHGLPVPWIGADKDLYQRIEKLGAQQIAHSLYHDDEALSSVSARAGVGHLLKILFSAILHPTDSTQTVSIVSAHDTTLMPILSACGAWDGVSWPGFCSWIAFELWSDDKVRIVFDGNVVRTLTLDEFAMLSEKLAPKAGEPWEEYCKKEHPSVPSLKGSKSAATGEHW